MPKLRQPDPTLPIPTTEEFAARLRVAREAAGWSQDSAAERLGMNRVSYGIYERDRVPNLRNLFEFVFALNLDPATLFPEFAGLTGKKGRKKSK